MRAACFITMIALLSFPTFSQAATITPRLQQALQSFSETDQVDVIVRMRNRVNLNSFRQANSKLKRHNYRSRLLRELKSRHQTEHAAMSKKTDWLANKKTKPLWLINGLALRLSTAKVVELARNPRVESIDLDAVVTLVEPLPATQSPPQWNIDMVKAPALWSYGYDGQGVVVASMDTGVDINHADLANSWRGGTNSWFDPYGQHASPADVHGHGTGTMSVIVGGNAGGTTIGVAPGAQWISVKIFNDFGGASLSAIHQGFQWLLDPDGNPATDDAPDVVNNSWGNTASVGICDEEFISDVETIKNSGIVVIFSAGNSGPAYPSGLSPATYKDSYAVGAVDQGGYIASFSSRGPSPCDSVPFPDVVAPGVNIKVADKTLGGLFPAAYTYLSGTSFAAPHVTGAVALLKSAYPSATISQLESAINNSAIDILQPGVDNDSGRGLLDTRHALFQLPVDTDTDTVNDGADNCILRANTTQIDSDGDGYGNSCDADFNNDGVVNFVDYGLFRTRLGSSDPDADLNGDNIVNFVDFGIFRSYLGSAPGPSGLVP